LGRTFSRKRFFEEGEGCCEEGGSFEAGKTLKRTEVFERGTVEYIF